MNEKTKKKMRTNKNLTIKELASLLECSRTTIWKYTKNKQLKCQRIGSRVFYAYDDAMQFIFNRLDAILKKNGINIDLSKKE